MRCSIREQLLRGGHVASERWGGGPDQRDCASEVRRRHRGAALGSVAPVVPGGLDNDAGGTDLGLPQPQSGWPTGGKRGYVACSVEGSDRRSSPGILLALRPWRRGHPSCRLQTRGRFRQPPTVDHTGLYHSSVPGAPQELLTMLGRRSGRGFPPFRSLGASMNCAAPGECPVLAGLVAAPLWRRSTWHVGQRRSGAGQDRPRRRPSSPSCECRDRRCRMGSSVQTQSGSHQL